MIAAINNLDSAIYGTAVWLIKWLIVFGGAAWIVALLRRPLRDRYEAEFLLDRIENAVNEGRSIERDLIDIAEANDASVGGRFINLSTWLKTGSSLAEALRKCPDALPMPIRRMLIFGLEKNTLEQVIPVCRRRLAESESKWRAASTAVAGSGAGVAFFAIPIIFIISMFVYPKFEAIAADMVGDNTHIAPLFFWFNGNVFQDIFYAMAFLVFLNIWVFTAVVPTRGFLPRAEWFLDRLSFLLAWLPWNRLRTRADLTSLIASFLDVGMSEDQALAYAGDAVGDWRMRRRIESVRRELESGVPLHSAMRNIESGGEFLWRVRSLSVKRSGFSDALANWHRSLDAKAMFKEQAAVQIYTTFLIIVTGGLLGLFAAGIFQFFTGLIYAVGAPW